MIEYFFNPQTIEALGWTLLHSLWQGAAFALLLAITFIALRSYTAQARYIVAAGLLSAFFLTAAATFWLQWQEANARMEVASLTLNAEKSSDVFQLNDLAGTTSEINAEELGAATTTNETAQSKWITTFGDYYQRHLPLLVTFWLLGIFVLQLRFLGQLAYVQRLKHYGTQLFPATWKDKIEELEGKLRIQKKVRYLTSVRIESPMVIGWLKPVVLLPRQLFQSLSETEIYAILAHELAHIRREDFIVNLIQTLLTNIFFFHPGVWWMSNQVADEREHCCDDLAVAATGQVAPYAKTLISVSEHQLARQGANPSLGMAFGGKLKKRERGGFTGRIRRLFALNNGAGTFREGFATACILIGALFLGVVATGHTGQSEAPQPLSNIEKTEISFEAASASGTADSDSDEKKSSHSSSSQAGNKISTIVAPPAPPAPIAKAVAPVKAIETRIDALVMACEEGDFPFVKTLIESGIDINGIGSEGSTPLMMAVSENHPTIVEYLLQNGATVNYKIRGWTALIEAADEGSLASMQHLLRAGAEVNYYSVMHSPTAISMAASEGHLDCLKLLLANGAAINGIGKSVPPLHVAAEENKHKIVDFLIAEKVDVNKRDAFGRTALMYAAAEGHVQMVKKLKAAGADVSISDNFGASAKDFAEAEGKNDVWDQLTTKDRPAIHLATIKGHIENVKVMVENGVDVNTRDESGRTALHLASAENHNIDMEVLLDLGADIDALDGQRRTPMMYAAAAGHGDAVALLVSKLADFNIEDVDGMRAYEWARSGGNSDLIQFLGLITDKKPKKNKNRQKQLELNTQLQVEIQEKKLERKQEEKQERKQEEKNESVHISKDGLHIEQYGLKNKTPELFKAARAQSIDRCRTLLNSGVDVNVSDDTGQTALMVAAMANRIEVAKFLLERGAVVNKQSSSGLTALHYAALENHYQMAQLLLNNNAKVDPTMNYSSTVGNTSKELIAWEYVGATPLLIAVEAGNFDIANTLMKAGANPNHRLSKIEYRLKEGSESYLGLSEVLGLDNEFKANAEIKISDNRWTPKKQALQMNKPKILALFPK